jgi:hypothetical protein
MKTWLSRLFRVFSGLLSALALLLTIAAVATGAAVFAGIRGESVAVLRFIAEGAGRLIAGQTTQAITLDLDADPSAGRLSGTATLEVRASDGPRRTFYFLLNPGLEIQSVQVRDDAGRPLAADAYRLLLATAVELDHAIPAGRSVRITLAYGGAPALEPLGGDAASFRVDRILLGPETFWYPYDAQSFFTVDATVRLPSDLEVVHNGVSASRVVRGATQEVAWRSERPVAGLALVAGRFARTERIVDDVAWRIFQGSESGLDSSAMIDSLAAAHSVFVDQFGTSEYSRLTVFVDSEVRRAFNDGSGVMATPPRYFREGDEGFHLLAHELAHVWWGGTVSERWLAPGTGGQWLVEGLATVSAALATEARYGQPGLERVRRENFFDPNRQGVIEQMSFLDNALSINTTRDTIYRKGGYVGLLLRTVVGPEAFARGLRDFVASHRFAQATLEDLQRSMEKAAGRDLSAFFDEWMRTANLPDLALEQTDDGRIEVTNLGRLPVAEALEIGHVDAAGALTTTTVHVGATVDAPAPGSYLVLDPALVWPDMRRANNRFPRIDSPASSAGDRDGLLTVIGTGLPWDRATAVLLSESGERRQTWDFPLGVVGAPVWSSDGSRAVVEVARAEGKDNDLVILETDGARRTAGAGTTPAFDSRGHLLAASDGRIIRIADGETVTVITDDDWELSRPQPSPTGRWLAYRAYDGARMQLRVRDEDSGRDVTLYAGERDVMLTLWARDESALYATLGSGTSWQIVRLPLIPASPSVLARDIASVADLELSPGGTMLALAAASAPAYPDPRHLLYTIDLESQRVQQIDVDGGDVRDVTWSGAETIVATVRKVPPAGHPRLPSERALWRVDAGDGTSAPLRW